MKLKVIYPWHIIFLPRKIFSLIQFWISIQKNKPGKIIVVYDDDEKLAPTVATSLLQKDVENVIMLSGGK